MKNVNKKNIIIGVCVVVGLGLLVFLGSLTSKKDNGGTSYLIDTTAEEYFELLKGEEKSVILLASPTCYWCQQYKPTIKRVSNEYKVKVYYVNTTALNQNNYTLIHDSSESLKDKYNDSGEPIIPTPMTLLVSKNKEVAHLEGAVDEKTLVDFLKKNGIISNE